MKTPSIFTFAKPADTARGFAEVLKDSITQAHHNSTVLNIALSGGSTPKLLFSILAKEPFCSSIPWEAARFFWGDERCVQPGSPESNYGMANSTLFKKINIPAHNLHRIRGEDYPASESLRYTGEILKYVSLNTKGLPVFDHIILGVGTDGHTASLFQGQPLSSVFKEICGVASHPTGGEKRITLTMAAINAASRVSFLVTGKDKSAIVKEILAGGAEDKYPAARVSPVTGNLSWFIDKSIKIK